MKILIGSIVTILLIWFVWRFMSRRASLPCPASLRWMVELDNPFTKVHRAEMIVKHLNLKPGMKVLDLGCGPGRVTVPVATAVGASGEVVAMDMQAGMIKRVQEKVKLAGLNNVKFVHGRIGDVPLENEAFDRILLVAVLGEIPDRESAIQALFDALKPGGILSVTETIFDPHYQRRRVVAQLANAVGLKESDFFGNRVAYTLHLAKPSNI